ncbi:MAG: S-layer homology domain-containing protein [Eubacteriales bacterium]|nr:S-layer homology domain-containing protein [Eubacteriales bacterium]
MKCFKIFVAILVLYSMILNCFSIATASSFTDVTGNEEKMVEAVYELGLMAGYEDNLWMGNGNMTRAEFSVTLCRLKGMDDIGKTQRETDFSDVDSTHWASGYIQTAYELGMTKGYNDGTYRPNDNVKYEEAVMMLVCALGYEPYAQGQGTYPTGYLYTANLIGLTEGAGGTLGQDVTRMVVTTLIYNALDIPLMEKFPTDVGYTYRIYDGLEYKPKKTALSEYLGAVKLSGILTHNSISNDSLKENQVFLAISNNYQTRASLINYKYSEGNEIKLSIGETNAHEFLGRKVDVFVTFEENINQSPTVLVISESSHDENKLTVELHNIIKLEDKSGYYSVTYWENRDEEKIKTFYIDDDTTFYVNSQQTFSSRELADDINGVTNVFNDRFTTIEFTQSGTDTGTYDYNFAFVSVYENFVVEMVDTVSKKAHPISASPSDVSYIDFSEDSDCYLEIVDENGNNVHPFDLENYDVLTMQVTPFNYQNTSDIRSISATLANKSIDGTIVELDWSDKTVTINDTRYEIAPAYFYSMENLFDIYTTGTFYLDANNMITAFKETTADYTLYSTYFKDQDKVKISKIGNSTSITAYIEGANFTQSPINLGIIIAAYNSSNELVKMELSNYEETVLNADRGSLVWCTLDISDCTDVDYIKAFSVNNYTDMDPLLEESMYID